MKKLDSVTILLVEDDDIDAEGVQRALEKAKIANPLLRVRDGVEALELLRGINCDPLPRPYILLIDLNLPRMNGLEFIREIRNDPMLRRSVVFVLSTSENDKDMIAAHDLNVTGYIVKSHVGKDFLELPRLLDCYWRICEVPKH